ncbi:DUF5694 domain-containing protein [bacterium]|nr:DUF5694 domain-containing protein [bacterium]
MIVNAAERSVIMNIAYPGIWNVIMFLIMISLSVIPGFAQQEVSVPKITGHITEPNQVTVMVVGCPHLLQTPPENHPHKDLVLRSLDRYEPDHVVVEWLHPSIDPTSTEMYKSIGDRETLARLWGYERESVAGLLQKMKESLNKHKEKDIHEATLRIELGKLYYLQGDQLNAGYQWWISQKLGAEVIDLKRMTNDNFNGHELEVFGFWLAYRHGINYITPFDYQGSDADWDKTIEEIFMGVAVLAVKLKHGVSRGDDQWEKAIGDFGYSLQAYLENGNRQWLDRYGDIKEVQEITRFLDSIKKDQDRHMDNGEVNDISGMHFEQSPQYRETQRKDYYEIIAGISIDSLGKKLVENFERRNQYMVDFVEQDIEKLKTKRILIIVGAGHKMFLENHFSQRGYTIVPSLDYIQ